GPCGRGHFRRARYRRGEDGSAARGRRARRGKPGGAGVDDGAGAARLTRIDGFSSLRTASGQPRNRIVPKETNMTDVSTFEDVILPADTVWNVIGDFGGIRKWAVLVQ